MTMDATPTELMRQASMTADAYLNNAVNRIDATLGEGYAAAHPELIAVFMQVCAQDFDTAISMQHCKNMEEIR